MIYHLFVKYMKVKELIKYNKLLGECKLDKISQKKKENEIEIIFEMDINKRLFITVKEWGNNNK